MKITPYIYILFYFAIRTALFAQNTGVLKIVGTKDQDSIILKQLKFDKTYASDSSYYSQLNTIKNQLFLSGFTQHYIKEISKNDTITRVTYDLGENINYIIISLQNEKLLKKFIGQKKMNSGELKLPIAHVNLYLKRLIEYFQDSGFPFVKIRLKNIRMKNHILYADLKIDKEKKRFIDGVIIKGYPKFPKSFVNYELNIQNQSIFNPKKIRNISEKIQNLAFVDEIKKPELLFKKDSTLLYLFLKKRKNNRFDGLIGMASNRNVKKLQLSGYLNIRLLNSLNYGEKLELNWRSDGNKSQNLELTTGMPYLFKSPVGASYRLNIYKKDTSFIAISNEIGLELKISNYQKSGVRWTHKRSDKINSENHNPDYSNISADYYGLYYEYLQPYNHPFFKTKLGIASSLLTGKRNREKQNLIAIDIQYLIPLNQHNFIDIKNQNRMLLSDTYYRNELFRIGGSSSIRGFDEQSLFTDKYSYVNIDYNYIINNESFISTISDFGLINNEPDKQKYTLYSLGLGYTTNTKAGLLRIAYSIGNTSLNPFSFNNSKVHLKLSQNF